MNHKKFTLWMKVIEDEFLEEAAMEQKKATSKWRKWLPMAAAACLVIAVGVAFLAQRPQKPKVSAEDLLQYGYELPLPEEATKVAYAVLKEETYGTTPAAEAVFTVNGLKYTLRAHRTEQTTDISGMAATEEPMVWLLDGMQLSLCSTDSNAWVGWYDTKTKMQWCLMTDADTKALLTTARGIVEELGYNVAVAPEGAEDITYDAFVMEGMTVAETTYRLEGVRYSYRMAATMGFEIVNISGVSSDGKTTASAEVGWCPAKLYYTDGGEGSVVWFDFAPGLLYSISMDKNATKEKLLEVAHELFVPAQDEADWK